MDEKESHKMYVESLEERAIEIEETLKEEGLLRGEFEIIGAFLYSRNKGSYKKLREYIENLNKTRLEAEKFLDDLKNGRL